MRGLPWLIGSAVFSTCLASPVLHAADNCSGFYGNEMVSSETVVMANGAKITFFTNHGSVSSADSAYNGLGGCGGYFYVGSDGKGWASGSCTRVDASGDNWSYSFYEDLAANGRGTWKGVTGTGKFANTSGNSGWYQVTGIAGEGKMSTGTWGGTCAR